MLWINYNASFLHQHKASICNVDHFLYASFFVESANQKLWMHTLHQNNFTHHIRSTLHFLLNMFGGQF